MISKSYQEYNKELPSFRIDTNPSTHSNIRTINAEGVQPGIIYEEIDENCLQGYEFDSEESSSAIDSEEGEVSIGEDEDSEHQYGSLAYDLDDINTYSDGNVKLTALF